MQAESRHRMIFVTDHVEVCYRPCRGCSCLQYHNSCRRSERPPYTVNYSLLVSSLSAYYRPCTGVIATAAYHSSCPHSKRPPYTVNFSVQVSSLLGYGI